MKHWAEAVRLPNTKARSASPIAPMGTRNLDDMGHLRRTARTDPEFGRDTSVTESSGPIRDMRYEPLRNAVPGGACGWRRPPAESRRAGRARIRGDRTQRCRATRA